MPTSVLPLMRSSIWVLLLVTGCTFDARLPDDARIGCLSGEDCAGDLVCFGGTCTDPESPCLDVSGKEAVPQPDGNACGEEEICIAGACVRISCGDGVVSGSEECDLGPNNSDTAPGACRTTCVLASCGDSVVDPGEECDDGALNDDAAADACRLSCGLPSCGDGVIDTGEVCDDGAQNSDVRPNACRLACVPSRCGDGIRDLDEGCDEGELNDDTAADACRTSCARSTCGDGVLDDGEACDDGDLNDSAAPDTCRETCALPRCGDGVIDEGEVCDDGAQNSDIQPNACRSTCVLPQCGDGVRDLDEGCDEGPLNDDSLADACRTSCARSSCGDGVIDQGEQCDAGEQNAAVADACRLTCSAPVCGDGIVDSGEQCDDGALNSDTRANACRTTCEPPSCGDGVIDTGEGCDEGALNDDAAPDACRTTCARATCGDGVIDSDESCDTATFAAGTSADACRSDCREMRCGDATVDPENGEQCDDANGNPLDGCGGCVDQQWTSSVLVSGSVEGRVAREVGLDGPNGVAVDDAGRLYVADRLGHRVVRVDPDGFLTTIAGTGIPGSGDRQLSFPTGVAVDASGRVFIADTGNNRIVGLDTNGAVDVIAGSGVSGFLGDGGPANAAQLRGPRGVAVDARGQVFIADTNNHRVRRVNLAGIIETVAGTGSGSGTLADGAPATSSPLLFPQGLAFAPDGTLVIGADDRVRRVSLDGTIRTIAGGSFIFPPPRDGLPALEVDLAEISSVAVDGEGRVVFTHGDEGNPNDASRRRVLRVEPNGVLTSLAGAGFLQGTQAEGSPGADAVLGSAAGVAVEPGGRVIFTDEASVLAWGVELDGRLSRVVGNGLTSFAGDGGAATRARLAPSSVAIDAEGRIFIAEASNHRVRRVDLDGTITTIAGTGAPGFNGDFIPATSAQLNNPTSVAVLPSGDVVISDTSNHRVRIVSAGFIAPFAGNGQIAFTDNGVPAVDAFIEGPGLLSADSSGRVYINTFRDGIFRVEPDGTLVAVASGVHNGFEIGTFGRTAGMVAVDDGSVIVAAEGQIVRIIDNAMELIRPGGGALALDGAGQVLIGAGGTIERLEADGTTTFLAGAGLGNSGDGGPATDATFFTGSIALDAEGRIFIAGSNRVRRIDLDGTITTVTGPVQPLGPGPFASASLYSSRALTFLDAATAVSVGGFGRVVGLDLAAGVIDVVLGYDDASPLRVGEAAFAPPLGDARGLVLDPVLRALVITERASGGLRRIHLDPDGDGVPNAAAEWTNDTSADGAIPGAAGIAYDAANDAYLVADEENHCVRRLARNGTLETVFGRCGVVGAFAGFLNGPTHVAVSPATGAIYIADTGNHRVLRVLGGAATLVIGEGSASSAGEGAPARLFPMNAPRQLALDDFGNLYVTSTTTVRLVANVDGDLDADGDDRVITIYGSGDRASFPESSSLCIEALARGADDSVLVADACLGFVVRLTP